jgi:hypothetical protein
MIRLRSRSARLLLLAGAIAAVVLGLALGEFSSPTLGRALLARASVATGVRLQASRFRLSLLRGLSLDEVHASGTYPGGRYELTLDRVVFEHRLLALLTGRLVVDRVRLDRPRAVLTETGETSRLPAAPGLIAVASVPIALQVVETVVANGEIEMRSRGRAPIVVHGLGLRLRDLAVGPGGGSALARLSGGGDFSAAEVALPVTRARDVAGTLRLSAGRLEASGVRFVTDEGRFQTRWAADLGRLPFTYALSVEGRPVDINAIAGLSGTSGGFGPAHLTVDGKGVGPEPAGLAGNGVLRLDAGTLPRSPLITAVECAIGRTGVSGARYKPSETPFRIERGRVIVERFRIDADGVGLEASGWSSFEGVLELSVAVLTPRASVRIPEVPPSVVDALAGADGWVRIPLRVTGTRSAPHVTPDVATLFADAKRAGGKALTNEALERLKGLLH